MIGVPIIIIIFIIHLLIPHVLHVSVLLPILKLLAGIWVVKILLWHVVVVRSIVRVIHVILKRIRPLELLLIMWMIGSHSPLMLLHDGYLLVHKNSLLGPR